MEASNCGQAGTCGCRCGYCIGMDLLHCSQHGSGCCVNCTR